jgi:hypothetical protein
MDIDYYADKIRNMLADGNTYQELENNKDSVIFNKMKNLIGLYQTQLTDKERDYLLNFEWKSSNFYGLPKVHKSASILKAVQEQNCEYIKILRPADLKFRPIVAGPACPTHRLSNLMDIILKPLVHNVQSYVRDDIDFLTKIPKDINQNEIFATFDITSLYSNIPTDLGLEALEYWLDAYPEHSQRFSKEFILESVKFVLENNSFCFDNKNFLQVLGTAMGSKCAPTYATLVLGYLEHKLYNTVKNKYGENVGIYFREMWKRYLDDCFIIWNKDFGDIKELHSILNDLHPNIKFTMEHSESEIPFLDILVKRCENEIITDIYYKDTDTKQYLHFGSCHPRATKTNIPYNLSRRICTIVTNPDLRKIRLKEMEESLIKRGYPKNLINKGVSKAQALSIEQLRAPKDKSGDNNIVAFVTTYNPNQDNMFTIVKNTCSVLNASPRCKQILQKAKIINSKRQPKSLKKILTKAKFEMCKSEAKVSKCPDKRCGTCPYLIEAGSFTFRGQTQEFKINQSMNCGTQNLLYVIECQGCFENYIGQTSTTLRSRIRVHKQQINQPQYRNCPVSKHISDCAGNSKIPFKVIPFYKILSQDDTFRDAKEAYFIKKIKPKLNGIRFD